MTTKPQPTKPPEETLEPCPFCGSRPETGITGAPECDNWRYVKCSNNYCSIRHSLFTVKSWNTRISPASAAPVVDNDRLARTLQAEAELAAEHPHDGYDCGGTCAFHNPALRFPAAAATAAPQQELRQNPRVNAMLVALRKVRDNAPTLETAQSLATIAIEQYVDAAVPVEQSEHDSCSHWREGDSDNCVWCGDDLGPTDETDVNEGAR